MAIHVTPIPRLTVLTAPAFTLGTSNAAGSAVTAVASNSTLLAFDGTDPAAVAASAVVGTATVSARRDHVHAGVTAQATTQAEMEAASSNTVYATPGRTQYHPGVAKFYVRWTMGEVITSGYNVGSVNDEGTGAWTINIANGFSAADAYSVICMSKTGDPTTAGVITIAANDVFTATEAIVYALNTSGALRNTTGAGTTGIMSAGYGDQ